MDKTNFGDQMTIFQALESLKENADYWSYDVPEFIFRRSEQVVIDYLLDPSVEECQQFSNEEWQEFIRQETEPIAAAEILMAWIKDNGQAVRNFDDAAEIHAAGESLTQ